MTPNCSLRQAIFTAVSQAHRKRRCSLWGWSGVKDHESHESHESKTARDSWLLTTGIPENRRPIASLVGHFVATFRAAHPSGRQRGRRCRHSRDQCGAAPPRCPLSNEVVSLEQDVILSPGAKAEAHADQEPIRRDDPACAGESVDRDNDRRRSGPRVTRPSERCGSQEALIFNGLMRMGTVNRKRSTLNAQRSTLNVQRSTFNAQRSTQRILGRSD